MPDSIHPSGALADSKTYPLGENSEHATALVALSHTPVEQLLYSAMLSGRKEITFTARSLMGLTGIRSLSTVRRGLEGLLVKLSISKDGRKNGYLKRDQAHVYIAYTPTEVVARRKAAGSIALNGHVNLGPQGNGNGSFAKALAKVAANPMLSRREAQVTLCCVEGLTNAEIGKRLEVSEQTVKFHLRHVFIKFGVKRRAELISKLLM